MSIKQQTKKQILELLISVVREKLETYTPETHYMPFHYRLLGRDRYAMFSFIQSMNTTFGMSIWKQVAVILATSNGNYAERQYKLLGEIDEILKKLLIKFIINLGKVKYNLIRIKKFRLLENVSKKEI